MTGDEDVYSPRLSSVNYCRSLRVGVIALCVCTAVIISHSNLSVSKLLAVVTKPRHKISAGSIA